MTNRNIIVVDIDDILQDLNTMIQVEAAKMGFHYDVAMVRDWGYIIEVMGMDKFKEALNNVYRASRHILHDGAVDGCHKLCELGYELHYFTDRPHGYKKITKDWFKKHNLPMAHNLHVCKDKREEIAKLPANQLAAIIDDRPRTMVWALTEAKIPKVFSLRTYYNQNLSDIPNIFLANDWHEMLAIMDVQLKDIND